MNPVNLLEKIFGTEKEPLQLKIGESAEVLSEQKSGEIEKAQLEASKLKARVEEELEVLKDEVSDMEDFKDEKGRKAVNDISDNLVESRIELINELELKEDVAQNIKELERFLLEFQNFKRKEAMVLEIASKDKDVGKSLKQVEEHLEQLKELQQNNYSIITSKEKIKELLESINQKKKKLSDTENKLNNLGLKKRKKEIEDKKKEIKEFKESRQFQEYEKLKEDREKLEEELAELKNEISAASSKMKRGLKKLIYQAENSEAELNRIDILRNIRDQRTEKLLNEPEKVEESVEQLEKKGDISQTQRKKLRRGSETLSNLKDLKKEMEKLEEEIVDKKKKINSHKAPNKLEEKKKDLEGLEEELADLRKEKEISKEKKESLIQEIDEKKKELKKEFKKHFEREIIFG